MYFKHAFFNRSISLFNKHSGLLLAGLLLRPAR